jgi:hypothetical protein
MKLLGGHHQCGFLSNRPTTHQTFYIYQILEKKLEFHNLYSSPSKIRMVKSKRMRCTGHVARMKKRNAYRLLVGKPEGKRPIGRPSCRWVDYIKMDL